MAASESSFPSKCLVPVYLKSLIRQSRKSFACKKEVAGKKAAKTTTTFFSL